MAGLSVPRGADCRVRAFPFKSVAGTVWFQGIWGAWMHECSDDFTVTFWFLGRRNITVARLLAN